MRTSRRALIVDDERQWAELAVTLLPEALTWEVTFATGAPEAIELLQSNADWDLLIVDYELAEGRGKDVVTAARQMDPNLAIGLMSSFDEGAEGFPRRLPLECSTLPFLAKAFVAARPAEAKKEFCRAYFDYMQHRCEPRVTSESGRLRTVMVHEPGVEVSLLDPDCFGNYLFEARLDHVAGAAEHRAFVDLLRRDTSGNRDEPWKQDRPLVLETGQLLVDVVRGATGEDREDLVCELLFGSKRWSWLQQLASQLRGAASAPAGLYQRPRLGHGALESLVTKAREIAARESVEIVQTVMTGLGIGDLVPSGSGASRATWDGQVVKPIPNLYFMRDPAFVLGNTVFVGQMYWPIRERETAIMKAIFTRHPFFAASHRSNRVNIPDASARPGAFREGGDAMAIGGGAYAVGLSERTTREAVRAVAAVLFENDSEATHLYQPVIPQRAEMMHLDTVCSLVGPSHFLTYQEAVLAYADTLLWTRENLRKGKEPESLGRNFIQVLEERFGRKRLLVAGGGDQARAEQRYDAANVLMVNPRRVVAYSTNHETNKELDREFGRDLAVSMLVAPSLLVGRGGPRCMTMPIQRD